MEPKNRSKCPQLSISENNYKNFLLYEPINWQKRDDNNGEIFMKNFLHFKRNLSNHQSLENTSMHNYYKEKNKIVETKEKTKEETKGKASNANYCINENQVDFSNSPNKIIKSLKTTLNDSLNTCLQLTENHSEKISKNHTRRIYEINLKTSNCFYHGQKTYHELYVEPALAKLNYPKNKIVKSKGICI